MEVRNLTPIADPYELLSGEVGEVPKVFETVGGQRFEDLIDTGWGFLFLISSQLLRMLKEEKVTGWSTWEAVIQLSGGATRRDYMGLSVVGRAGPINEGGGQVTLQPRRYGKGSAVPVRVGLDFDNATWDGSDIFVPAGSGFILCVERVPKLFRQYGITNARFKEIAKIEQLV